MGICKRRRGAEFQNITEETTGNFTLFPPLFPTARWLLWKTPPRRGDFSIRGPLRSNELPIHSFVELLKQNANLFKRSFYVTEALICLPLYLHIVNQRKKASEKKIFFCWKPAGKVITRARIYFVLQTRQCQIVNNYSPKWRWVAVGTEPRIIVLVSTEPVNSQRPKKKNFILSKLGWKG